jgi:hypothetical protein
MGYQSSDEVWGWGWNMVVNSSVDKLGTLGMWWEVLTMNKPNALENKRLDWGDLLLFLYNLHWGILY